MRAPAHRVTTTVPFIEVADDGHAHRIGCPHGEVRTRYAGVLNHVRTQLLPELAVRTLPDQVIVEFAEHRAEPVRVVKFPRACGIGSPSSVAEPLGFPRNDAF